MFISVWKQGPVILGAKLLLTMTSPVQGFIDRPSTTHEFLNCQAIHVLRNDGFQTYADFLEQHLTELHAGVYWADQGWKNRSHYFDPASGKGLWQFANALDDLSIYAGKAGLCASNREVGQAVFFLGAAAHLIQDLCVPHHARAKLFNGHKEYEEWVRNHFKDYGVESGGIYGSGAAPQALLVGNAVIAADFYDSVCNEEIHNSYHATTQTLLPLAQRTTAGLFERFCAMAGIPEKRDDVVA